MGSNNFKFYILTLLFFSFFPFPSLAIEKIILFKPQSDSDSTHSYYTELINLALLKINKTEQYSIRYSENILTQGRALKELKKIGGELSIYQTGTSIEREEELIPIRIPLLKGTLGHRISLIHKDNIPKFDRITTLKDLSKFRACQGTHWPDSAILENAGLPVVRNTSYRNMFLQVKNKRCDYFPRAIIEAYTEAEAYDDPDIVVYDRLIISYPFPMHFFVASKQKKLAQDIEEGLKIAIKDGSFDVFFKSNKNTKYLFPLNKWQNSTLLSIENPLLPRETPTNNPVLWMTLK